MPKFSEITLAELAKWLLALASAAALLLLGSIYTRLGHIEDRVSQVAERLARVETLTDTIAKRLDEAQLKRLEDAAKALELYSLDVRKAAIMASDAARIMQQAAKTATPSGEKK